MVSRRPTGPSGREVARENPWTQDLDCGNCRGLSRRFPGALEYKSARWKADIDDRLAVADCGDEAGPHLVHAEMSPADPEPPLGSRSGSTTWPYAPDVICARRKGMTASATAAGLSTMGQ